MTQVPSSPPVEPSLPPTGPQKTSGLAIAALVLGIIGLLTSCVGVGVVIGLVALVLGIVAISQISSEGNAIAGQGMAIAGIVLGALAMAAAVIALLIGILLPALGAARRTARQMQNNTQIRGIHQSMVMFGQGNQSNFPGLTGPSDSLTVVDGSVEGRIQALVDANYFTGEYLVSPSETLTVWQPGMAVTSANYSYALLQIAQSGGRQDEWRETLNPDAVAISDRNAGTASEVFSVHTESGDGWRGSVAFNDNHVVFELTHVLTTRYGSGGYQNADDLFTPAGADDAWMIHSGDGAQVEW